MPAEIVANIRWGVAALVTTLAFAIPATADEAPGPPTAPTLAGSSWRFTEVLGVPTPADVAASLSLATNGTVEGFSGCNQFFGYFAGGVGDDLSFSDIGYTKMWCGPEIMATETAVQQVLRNTSHMAVTPVELDLRDSDGRVLARLAPSVALPSPPN